MEFHANVRATQGSSASRRLRHEGKTPGIVYGNAQVPLNIEVSHKDLFYALKKKENEAFHSSILDLIIDGQTTQVLLRDYQMHPFKAIVLHVDFQRVDPTKAITLSVPLHYLGAEKSPAVKLGGAVINYVQHDLEIQCLPGHLPKFLSVDLSNLEAGQSVHAKDVPLPEGVALSIQAAHENSVLITSASAS